MQNLPTAIQTICDTWNSIHTNEFPNIGSWVSVSLMCSLRFFQLECNMYGLNLNFGQPFFPPEFLPFFVSFLA